MVKTSKPAVCLQLCPQQGVYGEGEAEDTRGGEDVQASCLPISSAIEIVVLEPGTAGPRSLALGFELKLDRVMVTYFQSLTRV